MGCGQTAQAKAIDWALSDRTENQNTLAFGSEDLRLPDQNKYYDESPSVSLSADISETGICCCDAMSLKHSMSRRENISIGGSTATLAVHRAAICARLLTTVRDNHLR